MDSIRVSEAPDPGSIPGETTNPRSFRCGGFLRMSSPNLFGQANKQKNRRATEGCHARGLSKFNTGGRQPSEARLAVLANSKADSPREANPPSTKDKIFPAHKFYRI